MNKNISEMTLEEIREFIDTLSKDEFIYALCIAKEYEELISKVNNAKNYYLHELSKREQQGVPTKMSKEAVDMYNIMEGNVKVKEKK